MADTFSFDAVSIIDMQEVDNALNQARKEIAQRYDFKGSKTSIELDAKANTLTVISDDDFKVKSVVDIVQSKMIRRGISVKALKLGKIEPAAGGLARQIITLQSGIDKENAKKITTLVKNSGLKVQAQIMGDQLRISGKSKDDLQAIMQMIRDADFDFATQFVNYR
jgi:uncharacterized protein YajQ (UPF0234 family)